MENPGNISWGNGSPVEFWADSPDLLLFDPITLDFLSERLASLTPHSHEELRTSLIELCEEMGDIAYYQIEDFSPGLYRLELKDIRKFGSEEEDMTDEEWEKWQSENPDRPEEGPPDIRYVGVDSAAILIADISHLTQLIQLLTPEKYDLAMAEDSVFPAINEALGGPYYALATPGPGTEFDGDGTYTIRKGGIKPASDDSPKQCPLEYFTKNQEKKPRLIYVPTVTLLAVLVASGSWMLTLFLYLGKQDPLRQMSCLGVSVIASVFYLTIGRKSMKERLQPGQSIALTGWQGVWVTLLVIAFGTFYWWMFKD
jgi:hypothetical protein